MALDIKELQNKFKAMSARDQMILAFLPAVFIAVALIYFIIMPAIEETDKLNEELKKVSDEMTKVQGEAMKLPKLLAENEALRKRLAELQKKLPLENEVSGLLKQVSDTATASGLQTVLWRVKDKQVHPSKEVYEIPVDVEMYGSYHNYGVFLGSSANLSRLVNFSNINIKPANKNPKDRTGLKIVFNTTTYSLIPEDEKKALLEKEKKEKKK